MVRAAATVVGMCEVGRGREDVLVEVVLMGGGREACCVGGELPQADEVLYRKRKKININQQQTVH